jgi:hypothetical protein
MIVSLHTPKTGGSSLQEIFKKVYGNSLLWIKKAPSLDDVYSQIMQKGIENTSIVHGHFLYGLHNFFPPGTNIKYITFLRDPYSQLLSHYNFLLHINPKTKNVNSEKQGKVLDTDLTTWINDSKTVDRENCMCRILSGIGNTLLDDIDDNKLVTDYEYQIAVQNMEKFFFIGLTETFSNSLSVLATLLDWRYIPNQDRVHYYPNRRSVESLTNEEKELISKVKKYDVLLFDKAKEINASFLSNIKVNPHLYSIQPKKTHLLVRRNTKKNFDKEKSDGRYYKFE